MPQRTGLSYIKNVPRQLPKGGRVLVHNCVHAEWQDQKPGVNGFRCWTAQIGRHPNMEPCDCGWSGLPHYAARHLGAKQFKNQRIGSFANSSNGYLGGLGFEVRQASTIDKRFRVLAYGRTAKLRNSLAGQAQNDQKG